MKNLIILTTLLVSASAFCASDMSQVSRPVFLNEGTEREIQDSDIEMLRTWAQDSYTALQRTLDSLKDYPSSEKFGHLRRSIEQIVRQSAPRNNELLMRYTLNRGLLFSEILEREIQNKSVGYIDLQVRLLQQTILIAQKYYTSDMEFLNSEVSLNRDYVKFGTEYLNSISELSRSIVDATAQYQALRTAIEIFKYDLFRDKNNKVHAGRIIFIEDEIRNKFPEVISSDRECIRQIRNLKKLL